LKSGRIFQRKSRAVIHAALVFICCCLSLPGANCQTPAAKKQKLWGTANRYHPAKDSLHQLKEALDLPQLPAYSGKSKFINGSVQPTEKGWIAYKMSYLTKENPDQVRDWYHNTFSMYQWKILHAKEQTITANHRDGHICTIVVNNSNRKGYKTELGVYYSMAPQQQEPSQN
jgi:hypothetical protein